MIKKIRQLNSIIKLHLQLDTTYFMTTGFIGIVQQVIGVSSGLFISYLFGHFTNKIIFGEYNLVLSIAGMLLFFSLPGLDQPLTRSVSLGYEGSLAQATKMKLRSSLLGLPILLLFAAYYANRHLSAVALALIILAGSFPLLNSFSTYPAYLTGKRKFLALSLSASAASLVFLVFLSLGIRFFASTVGLVSSYLLAVIMPALFTCMWCLRHISKKAPVDHKLPRYGLFRSILSILPWISGNIGDVLLANIAGAERLAIYAVASRFLTAVQKNFVVFYKPVTAKLANQSQKENWQTVRLHGSKLIFIGCLLAFILWFTTPILINFFFTREYSEAIYYGQLLSIALIPLPFTWVLSDMMIYQKRKKSQIMTSVVSPIIKIFLYFLFVPKYGITALILITLIERFTDPIIPFISLISARNNE